MSFCVVGNTKILPGEFATEYESVIAFCVASEAKGTEWENALLWILEKYSPEYIEKGKSYIEQKSKATKVIKRIDHLLPEHSGKLPEKS